MSDLNRVYVKEPLEKNLSLWRTFNLKDGPNRVLVFGVDDASSEALQRQRYKAYAGVSLVTFVAKTKATAAPEKEAPPVKEGSKSNTTSSEETSPTKSGWSEQTTGDEDLEEKVAELVVRVDGGCRGYTTRNRRWTIHNLRIGLSLSSNMDKVS